MRNFSSTSALHSFFNGLDIFIPRTKRIGKMINSFYLQQIHPPLLFTTLSSDSDLSSNNVDEGQKVAFGNGWVHARRDAEDGASVLSSIFCLFCHFVDDCLYDRFLWLVKQLSDFCSPVHGYCCSLKRDSGRHLHLIQATQVDQRHKHTSLSCPQWDDKNHVSKNTGDNP